MKNNKYRKIIVIVIVALLTILNIMFIKNNNIIGPYEVTDIIDGDTIWVNVDGEHEKIRLLCIDTPESVHPDKSKNTEEGEYASDRVKNLLEGESVYLEYDASPEDKYGRMLAYVYLDDGETMIERILLSEGLASIMTVQPNSKYADEFYKIQKKAREEGKGFWGTGFFEEE